MHMLNRLKADFRLSIITLLGIVAFLGITPFVFVHFFQGFVLAGVLDLLILLCIGLGIVYAWITGDTHRCSLVMAVVVCAGALAVAVAGQVGVFWLYPCLMVAFFLANSPIALSINLATIFAALLLNVGNFQSSVDIWTFFTTSLMTTLCAYVFARRTQYQHERLEQLATIDPLTCLKNRRSMDDELNLAIAHMGRSGLSYALVMLDIDHFKKINDDYGHSVGDTVLVDLATQLRQHTRSSDQVFRYGGEEFVLLLPGVDGAGLVAVMKNLQNILRKQMKHPGGPVSASFGVAVLEYGESFDSWLGRADAALYEAKAGGRDQIVFADSLPAAEMGLPA